MSFRASRRRVEKSVFEQISPLRPRAFCESRNGGFGRNDGEAFQQSIEETTVQIYKTNEFVPVFKCKFYLGAACGCQKLKKRPKILAILW
jgi:hypothetical protein